ncbi:helix-turn-helix domain-containing protein [Bacteroides cellulosilyticus]|uniref:Transcriptional regulator, AraC family n=1 Tax=Bacteroides cellulosilyticus DSM 14838 TaxID=537012 RepID=E2NI44_9BACE|nr:helix-turn-helix domain-containing protein [Bacteroides cellulosilyticus]EEF88425.1 transcriptional regulator, AraC family [Bacteroides cellulosilyticus DSM 14838]MBN9710719.1 AraC family transcriptional regulator [Bacteroides cellulosilyticus]MDC7302917.1 helix-turn-helix domain-containing protein [Bacteroides cellulosilyticus DSM 14838]
MRHFYYLCFLLLGFLSLPVRAGGDNRAPEQYTREYIMKDYMKDPVRTLQLLDKAEVNSAMPLNIVDELRSAVYRNMYRNKSALHYARRAYVSDSLSHDNPSHLLRMTVSMAELFSLLSEYKESMRYAVQGVELARELKDIQSECKLLFCMGENKRRLSFKEEGYLFFDQAIDLLDNSKNEDYETMLSYFYGVKMGYLIADKRSNEALEIGLQREKLLDRMSEQSKIRADLLDLQFAYVYSKLAYLFHLMGDQKRAAVYYKKYQSTNAASTPDGKFDATPYLLLLGKYQAVLDNCRDFKEVMRQQDTLNSQYLSILNLEIQANVKLENYKTVINLQRDITAIKDSIYQREKQNAALELDALYELNEKEARISQQAFQLKIRTITLICILSGALLALFFLWRLWHQNCVIRNKNKALVKRINEQFSMQEEMDRSQLGVEKDLSFPEKVEDESGDNEEQDKQMNKMIFEKLDYIIKRDKMYLSPDLSREELTRIVRMNNTRFAKMIKENTDTNLNGYINNLRLNYAIHLMKEQPDYTLRAIAESSGINSMPTFHQLFKGRTGMTPSEFKNAQKDMDS